MNTNLPPTDAHPATPSTLRAGAWAPPDDDSASPRRSRIGRTTKRTATYALYILASWPIHLSIFVLIVVTCALGFALVICWVGFPVLLVGVTIARAAATWQRLLHSRLTGRPEPERVYLTVDADAPPLRRFLTPLRDPQSWRDVVWSLVGFPISTVTWIATVTWVAGGVAGMSAIVVVPIRETIGMENGFFVGQGLGELLNVPHPTIFEVLVDLCVGLVCLLTAPRVLKSLAAIQLGWGEELLSRRARNRERIDRLTVSRAAARETERTSLRRLERDLHDGPQQRLVRLNMDLARAKRHAETDPAKARQILDQAMAQTQDTLQELRQLSRGIAPPVLVDRGLEAAIAEASARSIVPVTVRARIPAIPMHAASAAYFVVAESLVNVNKHSRASAAEVTVVVRDGHLRVTIADDGVGGADVAKGHGLAGLVERLTSVEGILRVSSPSGGPTAIEAVIPCES